MPKPLTRAQALENAAFLRALGRTGNVRLAARETGVSYGTIQHRRAKHLAFAQRWDAAMAAAHARLRAKGGGKRPEIGGEGPETAHRTRGGETVVIARDDGTFQVRSAQPGKLTRQCEQAFLMALSATANVRMSAAAAGASVAAFYRRKRRNPAFAREWMLALEMGFERVEMALIESFEPEAHEDDAWRHNEPPPVPPMTANQALQLLYLHQKEARLLTEPPHLKRRRGESPEALQFRLSAMWHEQRARDREAYRIGEAARAEGRQPSPHELPVPLAVELSQVTGWSRADPSKPPYDTDRALFGGWRLSDWTEREGGGD